MRRHRKLKLHALSSRRQGYILHKLPRFFYPEVVTCLTLQYGHKQLIYGLFNKNGV